MDTMDTPRSADRRDTPAMPDNRPSEPVQSTDAAFRAGFVTIVGRPNTGKSTLLNLLTGEKIAIMSDKPQTTRHAIRTIVGTARYQAVFIDTPGMHKPRNKLGEYMMGAVQSALKDVDAVIWMAEATDREPGPGDRHILEILQKSGRPVILVLNKIDRVARDALLPTIASWSTLHPFAAIIPASALQRETRDLVMAEVEKLLPEGKPFFPEDTLTDQPEKVLVQELIREKILRLLSDEVPHGTGVEVVSYKTNPQTKVLEIDANIYCERESHKGILIGKGGLMLKRIGTMAREDVERLTEKKTFLRLWVKVRADWRDNDLTLNELGYR